MLLQMSLCFMTYCTAIKHFLARQSADQTLLAVGRSNPPRVYYVGLPQGVYQSIGSCECRDLKKNHSSLQGGAILLYTRLGPPQFEYSSVNL